MQRITERLLGLALAGVISMGATAQAESPVEIDIDVDYATHYIWRGYDVTDGFTLPVQPGVTISHESGLSFNAWGSWALLDRDDTKAGDEINLTLDYARDIDDKLSVFGGFIYYAFPNVSSARTSELYLGAGYATLFSPSLTVFYDNEWLDKDGFEDSGFYFLLAGEYSVPAFGYSLDLGASLGLAHNDAFSGFQDVNLTAGTSIPLGPLTISPFAAFTGVLESSINQNDFEVFGGFTVSYSF